MMKTTGFGKRTLLGAVSVLVLALPALAAAQDDTVREDEIIVTATKKAGGVNIQDAPVAMTAYGEVQLDKLHARDIQSLSYSAPNVQLETIGTAKGVANFSIRGLGINSSIPSIDPTVGVFVDGVYLGVNSGVVFDTFDLADVEVLRGPQGLLFGRNVTGGAVLVNTTLPSDTPQIKGKFSVETGLNYTGGLVVTGPLGDSGKVRAKLAGYYNRDDGFFKNQATGKSFGKSDTWIVRPAVSFDVGENFDTTLRYEHGDVSGDGPASKNNGNFARNNFKFSIDEEGTTNNNWDQATAESHLNVGFGDGVFTNILGYREYDGNGRSDIDATPGFLFHANFVTRQDQLSDELRYNGTFGAIDVTTGLYYFTQNTNYTEQRLILGGALNLIGGGVQAHKTSGAFASFDYHATDSVTVTFGGRATREVKKAKIRTISSIAGGNCTLATGCTSFDFVDKAISNSFTPKIGMQWQANDDTQFYGFWTKGFRSGGFNLRNTSPTASPGPFGQEEQNSIEAGVKTDLFDGLVRFNAALFHNTIADMQRAVNIPDVATGVIQIVQNTANARIQGFDIDAQVFVNDNITLTGNLGHVDGDYTKVKFDISGDGVVDATDLALQIPRLAPWTYGAGILLDGETAMGPISAQVLFNHRDKAFYTDSNQGFLQGADMVDANLSLELEGKGVTLSVYGKNLLDEVTIGGDTQLPPTIGPFPLGGTFSPLNKGRIIGFEIKITR